ncbi:MAG: fused response regulator/phosphatase [Rhodocyclales bacterium]|nr:fused response regulator/phosphatase [Rhodocyclales bacterium]
MDMATSALDAGGKGIRILVADDQRVNQLILEAYLRKEGHTVLVANNGVEAVEIHRTGHPDLVLMDIMMPEMDGLEAARRILAECGEIRTPLLFLTAINDQQTMIEGLGLADDFIAKPIDLAILRAKLRAFIRLVQSQRLLREQQQRIERLNDDMRRESEVAAHVMERVLAHTEMPDPDYLMYRVQPSAMFSGDMVLARRTPGGRLHLLLADAVGHGLPAAINILPLFFPFDGMARKGCSLATVARELNRRVRDLLPVDRFVAATLVSIDFASNSFEIWNGGNPPALVLADDGSVVERIDSMQLALGLNADNPAAFEPRHVRCGSRQQLLLCSDGIWDNPAFSAAGDAAAAIAALMVSTETRQRIDALFDAAIDAGQTDDLSAVLVTAKALPARTVMPDPRPAQSIGARISLQLGPEALRRTDAVASVLDMAGSLGLVDSFPALSSVLPELFANALDHGVLRLDGGDKYRSTEGYQAFCSARQERLDALGEGFVMIEIEPDYLGESRVLRVNVADSGMGFDWQAEDAAGARSPGDERGLQRVRAMVANLSFNGQGSEVVVLISARGDDEARS